MTDPDRHLAELKARYVPASSARPIDPDRQFRERAPADVVWLAGEVRRLRGLLERRAMSAQVQYRTGAERRSLIHIAQLDSDKGLCGAAVGDGEPQTADVVCLSCLSFFSDVPPMPEGVHLRVLWW